MDGSAKEGKIAVAGIIRAEDEIWVIGSSKFIGVGSTTLAEAWALFNSLSLATSVDIINLEIETNSKIVYNLITNDADDIHPLAILIANCRSLLILLVHLKKL